MLKQGLLLFILVSIVACKHYAIDNKLNIREISSELVDFALYDPHVAGVAQFDDNRTTSGWTYFYIKTQNTNPDWYQTYITGYMEGNLLYELVWDNYANGQEALELPEEVIGMKKKVTKFIEKQLNWMNTMVAQNPQDNYWNLVNLTLAQQYGMYDGYLAAINTNQRSDLNLTFDEFYTITYASDIFDVISKYTGLILKPLKCSSLTRLTNESLFVSHTTWYDYTGLLRTYKVFDWNLQNPLVKTKRISFSSQPGFASSQDDFYILDNSRYVAETSLASDNNHVYSYVQFNSLPYWVRITVANLVFDTQQSWVDAYFSFRSGTYNNQWILVDFNKYNASKDNINAASDIIWFAEEFYQLSSAQDVTQELLVAQGYVGSYNVPYNATIQTLSKNPTNYTDDPRAILFAKYAPGIQTLDDFRYVMRLNNKSDTGDYCSAIAARCDLSDNSDFPFGALDCKVTSDTLAPNHQAWIIAGPTNQDVPAFTWDDFPQFNSSRNGIETLWNFDWVFMDPNTNFSTTNIQHGALAYEGYYAFIMEGSSN